MKRYAVHCLYEGGNPPRRQQVVVVEGGCFLHSFPLAEELPFTEWIGGVAVLSGLEQADVPLPSSFEDVLARLLSVPGGNVWHVEARDYASGIVFRVRRLQ